MRNKILSQAAGTAFKNQQNQPSFETGTVNMVDITGVILLCNNVAAGGNINKGYIIIAINYNNLIFHVNHACHHCYYRGSWIKDLGFYFSNKQEYVRMFVSQVYILCNRCRLN